MPGPMRSSLFRSALLLCLSSTCALAQTLTAPMATGSAGLVTGPSFGAPSGPTGSSGPSGSFGTSPGLGAGAVGVPTISNNTADGGSPAARPGDLRPDTAVDAMGGALRESLADNEFQRFVYGATGQKLNLFNQTY